MITREALAAIMPRAGWKIDVYLVPLMESMIEFEIDTPKREAAFLAQIAHESADLRYTTEIASGAAYDHRADLGNTKADAIRIAAEHGSTPGPWWKGHGLIQVTGYDNHLACGQALGYDLLNHPQRLEEPEAAARSAGWFWASRRLNDLADREDFETITRRINGGLNGFTARLAYWERAKYMLYTNGEE